MHSEPLRRPRLWDYFLARYYASTQGRFTSPDEFVQFLFDDGHEHINRDRDPPLSPQGVLGGAVESLDAQVLFDPFEEQLYLPTAAIHLGNRQWWQMEILLVRKTNR